MELKQLSNRVFYYPHQPETDRPMLAYIKGDRISLAIDAGNSADHVDEFYNSLKNEGLKLPDITAIIHWHWDHTFGLHHIHGLSIAHCKTNDLLEIEKTKLLDEAYLEFIGKDDQCLNKEYANNKEIVVSLADIQFEEELTINLGGITAKLFHTESPHSDDTVSIYLPEERKNTPCEYCVLSHTEPLLKHDLLEYLESL